MEEKEIIKPVILDIEETRLELIQCINDALNVRKLPCYIIDMILSGISAQIKEGAKSELNAARQQMNNGEEVA